LCLLLAAAVPGALAGSAAGATAPQRARVVVVRDPRALRTFEPQPERVRAMVERGLLELTGQSSVAAAWGSLVSTNEVVGIKVLAGPGPLCGTRPAVVAAVVRGLLAAGLPATNIVVWDKQAEDLRRAGFFELGRRWGVRVVGSAQAGYDPQRAYDLPLLGSLVWGDHEFGQKGEGVGRRSFLSKLVSRELTRHISVAPLLNHPVAGVSGNLYSLALGSVDNTARFEADARRLAQAVPEIYALPELSDRAVLHIVDGLLCQYQGGQRPLLHYSTVLNELRFSRDPVALDVLSLQELERQRRASGTPAGATNMELYLNAALLELGVAELGRVDVRRLE